MKVIDPNKHQTNDAVPKTKAQNDVHPIITDVHGFEPPVAKRYNATTSRND